MNPPTQNADSTRLRLATYNVHLGGARQATAQLLAEWRPDVLCLQEARDPARLPAAGGLEPVRMTRAEAAILDRVEQECGLVACWQAAHPGQPLARTLRWRHRADSLPYHCDGLFVPAGWLPALRDCSILTGDPWDAA